MKIDTVELDDFFAVDEGRAQSGDDVLVECPTMVIDANDDRAGVVEGSTDHRKVVGQVLGNVFRLACSCDCYSHVVLHCLIAMCIVSHERYRVKGGFIPTNQLVRITVVREVNNLIEFFSGAYQVGFMQIINDLITTSRLNVSGVAKNNSVRYEA